MAPLPTELQRAIEQGTLTDEQLRQLITLEAEALGLTYEQAIEKAKARTLPKNYLGADIELLVSLVAA